MSFNMNKYENVRFHSDELTHKRIKALLLWYEYEIFKREASPHSQLILIDRWIETLVKQEYYEVVPFFKGMKLDMIKKFGDIKEPDTDNVSEDIQKESFLTIVEKKIKMVFAYVFKVR